MKNLKSLLILFVVAVASGVGFMQGYDNDVLKIAKEKLNEILKNDPEVWRVFFQEAILCQLEKMGELDFSRRTVTENENSADENKLEVLVNELMRNHKHSRHDGQTKKRNEEDMLYLG